MESPWLPHPPERKTRAEGNRGAIRAPSRSGFGCENSGASNWRCRSRFAPSVLFQVARAGGIRSRHSFLAWVGNPVHWQPAGVPQNWASQPAPLRPLLGVRQSARIDAFGDFESSRKQPDAMVHVVGWPSCRVRRISPSRLLTGVDAKGIMPPERPLSKSRRRSPWQESTRQS